MTFTGPSHGSQDLDAWTNPRRWCAGVLPGRLAMAAACEWWSWRFWKVVAREFRRHKNVTFNDAGRMFGVRAPCPARFL